MQFDWALHSFIKKQSSERKHGEILCLHIELRFDNI